MADLDLLCTCIEDAMSELVAAIEGSVTRRGRSRGEHDGSGALLGVEVPGHLLARGSQCAELLGAEQIDQVAADAVHVVGCGSDESRPPLVGHRGEGSASIVLAYLALYESGPLMRSIWCETDSATRASSRRVRSSRSRRSGPSDRRTRIS